MGPKIMFKLFSWQVTTYTVVGLVATTNATIHSAVPIIIGANVGTSITSTVLSLSLYRERKELRWAFCAGTVHDIFNFLTASVILPTEHYYPFMERITGAFVKNLMGKYIIYIIYYQSI